MFSITFLKIRRSYQKTLVLGPRETVSYTKIYADALKLASKIQSDFGEHQNILMLCENSVFSVTVYLALLKSGNVCVPLNPNIEPENLQKIVSKTGSKVAFVNKKYTARFSSFAFQVFDEEAVKPLIDQALTSPGNFNPEFDENRLAEIIFTSGSTGEQKGVMITHRNIIANTNSIIEYLKLTQSDTIEIVMPFYYCYGLSLLHTHLRVGGSVVLNNTFIFIGSVINDLNKYNCTGFAGVPSHFQILLRKTKDFKTDKISQPEICDPGRWKTAYCFYPGIH